MKTAVIGLTKNGCELALKIGQALPSDVFLKYPVNEMENAIIFTDKLSELIAKIYKEYNAFILIMATGIAFRTFAPYIEHKSIDPALVVLDEKGKFAISLLSGHLGGANELATEISEKIGTIPVITTATDVSNKTAFDMVAKKNGLIIENINELHHISGALVNGDRVSLLCHYPLVNDMPAEIVDYNNEVLENIVVISNKLLSLKSGNVLYLRPKNLILGIGCRRHTPFAQIENAFSEFMQATKYSPLSIKAMGSIDLKQDEEGILAFSEKYKIPFTTFPAEILNQYAVAVGDGSDFVKETTGTSSVAQSAALALAKDGKTVVKKTIHQGITFSLAEELIEIEL